MAFEPTGHEKSRPAALKKLRSFFVKRSGSALYDICYGWHGVLRKDMAQSQDLGLRVQYLLRYARRNPQSCLSSFKISFRQILRTKHLVL